MFTEVRRHESARLHSMLEQNLNVAVIGGPGMGKSTMVNAVARLPAVDAMLQWERRAVGMIGMGAE